MAFSLQSHTVIFSSPSRFLQPHQDVAKIIPVSSFLSALFLGPLPLMCFIARAFLLFLCIYSLLCISLILLKLNPGHTTSLPKTIYWLFHCLLNRVWHPRLSQFSLNPLTNTVLLTIWIPHMTCSCVPPGFCSRGSSLLKCPPGANLGVPQFDTCFRTQIPKAPSLSITYGHLLL